MKFIVASHDGERVLCQFADMTPMQWLDARVAEAIGYSYAIRFETRAGADRCAFMQNGAVVALGDWENDTDGKNRSRDGGCTCGLRASQRLGGGERRPRGLGAGAGRGGPVGSLQVERPRFVAGAVSRGRFQAGPRMPPLAEADWRARSRDARLNGAWEWEEVAR